MITRPELSVLAYRVQASVLNMVQKKRNELRKEFKMSADDVKHLKALEAARLHFEEDRRKVKSTGVPIPFTYIIEERLRQQYVEYHCTAMYKPNIVRDAKNKLRAIELTTLQEINEAMKVVAKEIFEEHLAYCKNRQQYL